MSSCLQSLILPAESCAFFETRLTDWHQIFVLDRQDITTGAAQTLYCSNDTTSFHSPTRYSRYRFGLACGAEKEKENYWYLSIRLHFGEKSWTMIRRNHQAMPSNEMLDEIATTATTSKHRGRQKANALLKI